MKRSSLVLTAVALFAAVSPAVADEAAAREYAAKVLKHYASLRSYQDKMEARPHVVLAEGETDDGGFVNMLTGGGDPETMSLAWMRPNRFAIQGQSGGVASDGAMLTMAFYDQKQYRKMDAPEKDLLAALATDFIGQQAAQHPMLALLLGDKSGEGNLAASLDKVKNLTDGKIGERAVKILHTEVAAPGFGSMPIAFHVDDKTMMIARVSVNLDQMLENMPAPPGMDLPKIETFEYHLNVKEYKINEQVTDAALALNLEGFEEVEEFDFGFGMPMDEDPLEVGIEAPSFQGKTLAGDDFSITDLRGSVVLLDFWATWCGPCVAAIPTIQKVALEYADQGLVVVGINQDMKGQESKVQAFVDDKKLTFTQVLDAEGTIGNMYKVTGIPTTVIIDAEGVVRAYEVGFHGEEALIEMVREALGK